MAARTTDANVRAIIKVSAKLLDIEWAITMANELTTECCGDAGYSDVRLELIERCLAAHFATLKDPRRASERASKVSASYDTIIDLGFNNTHHGQAALRLDTAGGLAALDSQAKGGLSNVTPGLSWLGQTPEEIDAST